MTFDVWDAIVLLGLGLLGAGLWMRDPWVALTVVGALVILLGVFGGLGDDRGDGGEPPKGG